MLGQHDEVDQRLRMTAVLKGEERKTESDSDRVILTKQTGQWFSITVETRQ